jgi:mannose-6-phosphate isomerase-like protein (cupin superfamily)
VTGVRILSNAGAFSGDPAQRYVEHLRVPDLSVGTYSVPAGGTDTQQPHTEDEVYVVTAGRGRLVTGDGEADVAPGDVIFVPAGEEHRFVALQGDFAVLVIFAPAEYSRAG